MCAAKTTNVRCGLPTYLYRFCGFVIAWRDALAGGCNVYQIMFSVDSDEMFFRECLDCRVIEHPQHGST